MKKTFTILVTALTINAFAQIPTSGLVGYYPFTGNANDLSGNNNNGTATGATLIADRFGNPNAAYNFNGSTDYITVPSSSSIANFPSGQTLSFWAKISAYPTDGKEHYMIDKTDNSGSPTVKYYQAFISDYSNVDVILYRYAQSSSSSSQGTTIPFSGISLNQWFHLCFTTDLTLTKAYVNGVHVITYNHYSPIGVTNNPLKFGNTNGVNSTNAPYNGALDDIRIYNRAVDSLEVQVLYNERICYQSITVTDTLIINTSITGFNPVTYQNTIKIFPNPTHDQITINYGNYSAMSGYTIKITNSLGQVMFTAPINQAQSTVNLSTWTGNGIYFVNVIDATGNIIDIKKIVLQ